MNIKGCLALTRGEIIEQMQFRLGAITVLFGNLIYLLIIYFLWKAIYASSGSDVVNGLTFSDTMIYLVLAMSLYSFMDVYLVWQIGRDIQSGTIILNIIKPISFQAYMFFGTAGSLVFTFFTTLLPTMVVVYFLSGRAFALGINLIFFFVSIILSAVINYMIDFFVGTICLYTQSIWGINIMKQVIVLLLSGASIPLAFFPEVLKKIVYRLPFHAIYNTPLTLLINNEQSLSDSFRMILIQLFWLCVTFIITKVFWKISIKRITVNGG